MQEETWNRGAEVSGIPACLSWSAQKSKNLEVGRWLGCYGSWLEYVHVRVSELWRGK